MKTGTIFALVKSRSKNTERVFDSLEFFSSIGTFYKMFEETGSMYLLDRSNCNGMTMRK